MSQVTPRQERILGALCSGLKSGIVNSALTWRAWTVAGETQILKIEGLPEDIHKFWITDNHITIADFQDFVDLGLMQHGQNQGVLLLNAKKIIDFAENFYELDNPSQQIVLQHGITSMDDCYLSERQKKMLEELVPHLISGLILSKWSLVWADDYFMKSWERREDRNSTITRELWSDLDLQDLRDFEDCGLLQHWSENNQRKVRIHKAVLINFVKKGFKHPEQQPIIMNHGVPTMDNHYLTDRQKHLLESIVPSLKNESLETNWGIVLGGDSIRGITNIPSELWNNHWKGVKESDFQAFVDCGLFTRKAGGSFLLNPAKIIAFVENGFKYQSSSTQQPSLTFNFHGEISGQGISIGNILNNSAQSIQVMTGYNEDEREQLEELVQKLEKALEEVPKENKEDAEATAMQAARLIEDVKSGHKSMIKISADGLKAAATNLAVVTPAVLSIANQIVTYIAKLTQQTG